MSTKGTREKIDSLDRSILELLNERAEVVRRTENHDRPNVDPLQDLEEHAAVVKELERAQADLGGAFPSHALEAVFREINSACASLREKITVAYLGPPGTFTHMAARSHFGMSADYREGSTIATVFDAVMRQTARYGVVPIENSTEGGVSFTLDCLLEYDLFVRDELVLQVSQCLVGLHHDLTRVERVYSHPQGLAQCRTWLAKHLPSAQLVVSPSTSAAAKQAAEDDRAAAIASQLSAELYGLELLRQNVQDRVQNATRFIVLAHSDAPPTGVDKTSLVFSTPHTKGALRAVLEIFDEEALNLTRIESRPFGSRMWEYAFFTDFEGHRTDPPVTRALERLRSVCGHVKVLGSYPRSVDPR